MNEQVFSWLKKGNWRAYEAYVHGSLSESHPHVKFSTGITKKGRFSGRSRQIDILAETQIPMAIECKYFARKVDVKDVEAFLGMLDDLEIPSGLLITGKGFTKAAQQRAQNDPRALSLEIISPERLSQYQFLSGPLIYKEGLGVCFCLPFGWLADTQLTNVEGGALVVMYPLGRSLAGAMKSSSILYANIMDKVSEPDNLKFWSELHFGDLLDKYPNLTSESTLSEVVDRNSISRSSLLRKVSGPEPYVGEEYALYVEYDDHVLLLVLNYLPNLVKEPAAFLLAVYNDCFHMNVMHD
jgi:hypothetical protein